MCALFRYKISVDTVKAASHSASVERVQDVTLDREEECVGACLFLAQGRDLYMFVNPD